jgi:hypothetical protein
MDMNARIRRRRATRIVFADAPPEQAGTESRRRALGSADGGAGRQGNRQHPFADKRTPTQRFSDQLREMVWARRGRQA